jgi:hypothetical protein
MRDPRSGPQFKFLQTINDAISAVYTFFNLGKKKTSTVWLVHWFIVHFRPGVSPFLHCG